MISDVLGLRSGKIDLSCGVPVNICVGRASRQPKGLEMKRLNFEDVFDFVKARLRYSAVVCRDLDGKLL